MDKLQIILLEEGEFTDHNYDLMQSTLEYWNTFSDCQLFNYIEQYY